MFVITLSGFAIVVEEGFESLGETGIIDLFIVKRKGDSRYEARLSFEYAERRKDYRPSNGRIF